MNNVGQVIGESNTFGEENHAFLWDDGNMIDLGVFEGHDRSSALDVNDQGEVVGWSGVAGTPTRDGVVWKEGEMIDIGHLPGGNEFSNAGAKNDLSQVVGTSHATDGFRALLWDEQFGLRDLNTLIDPESGWTLIGARSINNHGQITGSGVNPDGFDHAYLLTPIPEPSTSSMLIAGLVCVALSVRRSRICVNRQW